jgi:hypothetical protein
MKDKIIDFFSPKYWIILSNFYNEVLKVRTVLPIRKTPSKSKNLKTFVEKD